MASAGPHLELRPDLIEVQDDLDQGSRSDQGSAENISFRVKDIRKDAPSPRLVGPLPRYQDHLHHGSPSDQGPDATRDPVETFFVKDQDSDLSTADSLDFPLLPNDEKPSHDGPIETDTETEWTSGHTMAAVAGVSAVSVGAILITGGLAAAPAAAALVAL